MRSTPKINIRSQCLSYFFLFNKNSEIAMDDIEVAPFRPLDDFLLSSARYQVPNFRDANRCVNRIMNNLLYYQSNYFVAAIIIFVIVG